jgi:hypothetical protein
MRRELQALAKSEGISVNQLISLAIAEKIVRSEPRPVLGYPVNLNSSTLHEANRSQRLETHASVFGSSLKLESEQHLENLIALGMPATPKKIVD